MTTPCFDDLIKDLDVQKLTEMIRVAETAERYDDMCKLVGKLVKMKNEKGEDLDVDERRLLCVAYKNVVGSKRASWKTLAGGFDDADEELLNKYKKVVEDELETICNEVLNLLKAHLCPSVKGKNDEVEVFYLKMCGDYYRYLCEFTTEQDKATEIKKNAEKYYKDAMDVAEANLKETNPTRLGLALNFSLCYHEILKEPEKACQMAKNSFDAAVEQLDTLDDASYKDSMRFMQVLRDNLTVWRRDE